MRLAAQMRGGFYPAPEDAVAHAARFLRPPYGEPFAMLDPCAGEGAAIRQLGELLPCPNSTIFAVELDEGRSETLRRALPHGKVLAPASFFGVRASASSFSFVWLNPPFDYSYGGCRVEEEFLRRATGLLCARGVVALVCPEDVADEYSDVRRHFLTYYENCAVTPFPERCRQFNEVVVFGQKRLMPRTDLKNTAWQAPSADFTYQIPPAPGPKIFHKVEPTEPELRRMLAASPLRTHLTVAKDVPLAAPPLPLGIGHIALLLASGHLDGLVQPEGQPAHVVRGTARKHEFVSDVSDNVNEDGSVTTRTTIAERIELVVRAVDSTGNIHTFTDAAVDRN